MENQSPTPLYSLPILPATDAQSNPKLAILPVSKRVEALLKPNRTITRYRDHQFDGVIEIWDCRSATIEDLDDLQTQLNLIKSALIPMETGRLLARILSLLSLYRSVDLPPAIEEYLAEDWLDDLAEFPEWSILDACRAWRRDRKRYRFKPLPGDIRALCIENVANLVMTAERLAKLIASISPMEKEPMATRAIEVQARILAVATARRMP